MLVLVGHSASGKTEIANELKLNYGLKKVITYTSRPMRTNEVNGLDYHFVSNEEFLKLKEEGQFIETTFFNGYYYGSSKKDVRDESIIVLDPLGLDNFVKANISNLFAIFLDCDEDIRYRRMLDRGDKEENAKSRIIHDREKFSKDKLLNVNLEINTSIFSIKYLAKEVYDAYQCFLNGGVKDE